MRQFLAAGFLALAFAGAASAQSVPPGSVLILHDSIGSSGWIANAQAKLLANLLGHFDLPFLIKPVTNYVAGDMDAARATFYLGTVYDNPLPAAFTSETLTTTNTLCWFRYDIWKADGASFRAKFGFRYTTLDATGYSNVLYKGTIFSKNQASPELVKVSILDSNLATVIATANKMDSNGVVITNIPYVVRSGKFWFVADSPFDYVSEENRYTVFCDVLHDILGINHAEIHRAIIRIEDVSAGVYSQSRLRQITDLLRTNNAPFALATIPVYTDPLGYWTGGTPVTHRVSDATNFTATSFRNGLRYASTNGGQLIMHGYTHQYGATNNSGSGVSGDDYEFWRVFPSGGGTARPIPEDSPEWATSRFNAAKDEFTQAGLNWVAWETPHYTASAVDYQTMATNFPLFMERSRYFADDYDPQTNANHYVDQFFPYIISRDYYGRKIIPENLNYFTPPTRTAADMIRVAQKNLVVRDGWASGFFHGYLNLTNLQDIVTGIQALGYTYVPLVPAPPAVALAATPTPSAVGLAFPTQLGFRYSVEYKSATTNSAWLTLTNVIGSGGVMNVGCAASGPQGYYRLRAE